MTTGAQVDNEEKKDIFLSDEDIMDVGGGVCMGHGVAETKGIVGLDSKHKPSIVDETGKGNYND